MDRQELRIEEFANAPALGVGRIRYYERRGHLKEPALSESG